VTSEKDVSALTYVLRRRVTVLIFIENEFVEIVREDAYQGVYTICCGTQEVALAIGGQASTLAEPLEVSGQNLPWVIHIEENVIFSLTRGLDHRLIEGVKAFTPAPKAYAYSYLVPGSLNENGVGMGDYGFCWPDELEITKRMLTECEDPVEEEIIFVPIWYLPDELTGATRNHKILGEDLAEGVDEN
jgi:hypothetical protein